jgi:hypothetical protein
MSEWNRSGGGWLPHDEASTREHFEEVGEDVRREREADRLAKAAHRKRPWWRFWGTRSS